MVHDMFNEQSTSMQVLNTLSARMKVGVRRPVTLRMFTIVSTTIRNIREGYRGTDIGGCDDLVSSVVSILLSF
jgi:hypothetical protein